MKALYTAALVAALGLAGTGTALADPPAANDGVPVQLNVNVPVKEQLAGVERALYTERYSEVTMEEKSKVSAAINRIRTRLGDKDTVEQTNPQAQTEILNDQALINTVLQRAHADSRMVCRRERATGTNRPERVCLTVAQRRELQENSKEGLQRFQSANRGL